MTAPEFHFDQFDLRRFDLLQEFTCGRCQRPKKSKNVALDAAGTAICNACYGELKSKR